MIRKCLGEAKLASYQIQYIGQSANMSSTSSGSSLHAIESGMTGDVTEMRSPMSMIHEDHASLREYALGRRRRLEAVLMVSFVASVSKEYLTDRRCCRSHDQLNAIYLSVAHSPNY